MGYAMGAAATEMRPIGEIMFPDLLCLAMDQIVTQVAKKRHIAQRGNRGTSPHKSPPPRDV